jgi:hypothetical protein
VMLRVPGRRQDRALGHCTLNLETGAGRCKFVGGRGRFAGFHARVAVSHLGGPNYAWDGTYRFSSRAHRRDHREKK